MRCRVYDCEGREAECSRCQAVLLDSGRCWYCNLGHVDPVAPPHRTEDPQSIAREAPHADT